MSKHSPGPWHKGQGNGEGHIFAKNGRMRLEEGGTTLRSICRVTSGWQQDEDEANADLIAAAPALLEGLKGLFEHCVMIHSQWGDGCNQKQADAAKAFARAAIAQAEGSAV